MFGHALAITLLVVAWGYLVYVAIDFGSSARGGRSEAWWLLALASVGAVACLFAGLLVASRLARVLGWSRPTDGSSTHDVPAAPPRVPGGRRAAR